MQYITYSIDEAKKFNSSEYPEIENELISLKKGLEKLSDNNKVNIAISFWKNHAIRIDWIKTNPEITQAITSETFPSVCIQSLFNSSSKNRSFSKDYEDYIRRTLSSLPGEASPAT
jgi:hypothetical protein